MPSRRDFLNLLTAAPPVLEGVFASRILKSARWRGFNLQEKFTDTPAEWANTAPEWGRHNEPFLETDFTYMAEWGFNFARLPMSYRCWTKVDEPYRLLERPLKEIDQAVRWGRDYGVHVCLNFHRAPGFCINDTLMREPLNLWTDPVALDILTYHWCHFAERYKGIPSSRLSFNLINEPNRCTSEQYVRVIRHVMSAIRAIDAERLVMIDGLFGEAVLPIIELAAEQPVIHGARGYAPFQLTHYLAPWAGTPTDRPSWPVRRDGKVVWDVQQLDRWCIYPWMESIRLGATVFVGEWGCWNHTPHDITLAWMRDFLNLWKKAGWGWALWCFRGSFGLLDSHRKDVRYETWRGHKLDRKMLELLREF